MHDYLRCGSLSFVCFTFTKHVVFLILQKDRPQRRRPGLANRLRDDRNRREHERNDGVNDGEQFDNLENSPTRDRQSKAGGLEVGTQDESMYDAYGAQGMNAVPPFASDMPPVLMPVPGAGLVTIHIYFQTFSTYHCS